jgi:hypothetical protein
VSESFDLIRTDFGNLDVGQEFYIDLSAFAPSPLRYLPEGCLSKCFKRMWLPEYGFVPGNMNVGVYDHNVDGYHGLETHMSDDIIVFIKPDEGHGADMPFYCDNGFLKSRYDGAVPAEEQDLVN